MLDVLGGGLPLSVIEQMAIMFEINRYQVASLLGVSVRALQYRKRENSLKTLPMRKSDKALQLARLMNEAVEYFGTFEASNRWMKTASKGLGDKMPLALCNNGVGMEMVRESINRLKYGMTA